MGGGPARRGPGGGGRGGPPRGAGRGAPSLDQLRGDPCAGLAAHRLEDRQQALIHPLPEGSVGTAEHLAERGVLVLGECEADDQGPGPEVQLLATAPAACSHRMDQEQSAHGEEDEGPERDERGEQQAGIELDHRRASMEVTRTASSRGENGLVM